MNKGRRGVKASHKNGVDCGIKRRYKRTSRASFDRQERSIERTVRQEAKREIEERLSVHGKFVCPVPDYIEPPGGVPVLGIDFMAGPAPYPEGSGHFWEPRAIPGRCAHGLLNGECGACVR